MCLHLSKLFQSSPFPSVYSPPTAQPAGTVKRHSSIKHIKNVSIHLSALRHFSTCLNGFSQSESLKFPPQNLFGLFVYFSTTLKMNNEEIFISGENRKHYYLKGTKEGI